MALIKPTAKNKETKNFQSNISQNMLYHLDMFKPQI